MSSRFCWNKGPHKAAAFQPDLKREKPLDRLPLGKSVPFGDRDFPPRCRAEEWLLTATQESGALTRTTRNEVRSIISLITEAMIDKGFEDRDVFAMHLALEEALVNAIQHGHRDDPTLQVRVRYQVTRELAVVEVEDQGPGFDPRTVPDPLTAEGIERPAGRGLLLMRSYLSWLKHNERGNRVTLCKYRPPEDADSLPSFR
jgi:serine/threonine-protein kinase RsbW